MKIGMTGLGKMGGPMKRRIEAAGHEVVGFDIDPNVRDVDSIEELVASLEGPRVIWMMLPLQPIIDTLDVLEELLQPGDIIVDGGNSDWKDTVGRAERFALRGIEYVDCGTSGGIWGEERGYALMVGGSDRAVEILMPIFDALKPEEDGFVHAGGPGEGAWSKEIHNGALEYAMMAALGEAYEMLAARPGIKDPVAVMKSWRHGTIVQSFLLDLAVQALEAEGGIEKLAPIVQDSGEGRWTLRDAIEMGVSLPVASAALFDRFSSRGGSDNARRMASGLRNVFGGHAVTAKTQTKTTDVAGESPESDPTPQGHGA